MSNKITISGAELAEALRFITGANEPIQLDEEFSETEIVIEKMDEWTDKEEGQKMPAGLYVSLNEYPEEGLYGPLKKEVEP